MPTVLLVDDSATDRRMIGGLLERNKVAVRYAENGKGALKQLQRTPPDLVLTDMQMPEMNGLELVKAIRKDYAEIPVILMTAHGSEQLAADALRSGAASYVPKSQAASLLVDAVMHVADMTRGDANYRRLIDHTTSTDFHFELQNDLALIDPLIALIQQMISGIGVVDPAGCLQVGVAVEQAVENAILHGNLELTSEEIANDCPEEGEPSLIDTRAMQAPYCDRKVKVRAFVSRDEVRVHVCDEGQGFDVKTKLNVSLSDDDTVGRGLVLMWALMDKVTYSRKGNEVSLVKLPTAIEPSDHAETQVSEQDDAVDKVLKLGELVPLDGGESIRLSKERISVGRDPSCDVVLRHSDVSHEHCLLYMYSGWWYVKDLKSANGTRLNKQLINQKRIQPGAILAIGKHQFEARYSPWDLGAEGITPPVDPF